MTGEEVKQFNEQTFIARHHPVFFISGIAAQVVSALAVIIGLVVLILVFDISISGAILALIIGIVVVVLLYLAGTIFLNYKKWQQNYFVFSPKQITHYQGGLSVNKQVYDLDQVYTCTVRQGMLGKKFNYGDLEVYNPMLETDKILVYQVPDPEKLQATFMTLLRSNQSQAAVLPMSEIESTANKS
jgi:membrane protein YdbS with pleckstrin-like domain